MPSYATPQDIVERFDFRTVRDLVSDDEQDLSRGEVLVRPALQMALDSASGRVEASLMHGGRYTVENLNELTDNSLAYLKQMVCELAMVVLMKRRPGTYTDLLEQMTASTEGYLKLLQDGRDVFNLTAKIEAGKLTDGGTGNKETVTLIKQRSLVSDNMISQKFPRREVSEQRYRQ